MKENKYIVSRKGGRNENQDFFGSAKTQLGDLIIVCDGMGGHKGGRHAAELAVQIIIDEVSKSNSDNPVITLQNAIEKANAIIWEEGNSNSQFKGMGTTVVALLITNEEAICCHVGDSRVYQLRDRKILHRTFDHSHVFELVKHGILTEEQARLSEKSNIITRALGIEAEVKIETTDNLEYKKGDRFLLCTDGIWGQIPENELVEMISRKTDLETVLNQLVEKIDSIGFANGGKHDNLTAALIEIESDSGLKKTESKPGKEKIVVQNKKCLIFLLWIIIAVLLAFIIFKFNEEEVKITPLNRTEIDSIVPMDTAIKKTLIPDSITINENN